MPASVASPDRLRDQAYLLSSHDAEDNAKGNAEDDAEPSVRSDRELRSPATRSKQVVEL